MKCNTYSRKNAAYLLDRYLFINQTTHVACYSCQDGLYDLERHHLFGCGCWHSRVSIKWGTLFYQSSVTQYKHPNIISLAPAKMCQHDILPPSPHSYQNSSRRCFFPLEILFPYVLKWWRTEFSSDWRRGYCFVLTSSLVKINVSAQ